MRKKFKKNGEEEKNFELKKKLNNHFRRKISK